MSRTFQDGNFLRWEAYASGGEHGYADHARIVFHCLSDQSMRARAVQCEGDQSDAEHKVETASDAELVALLETATDVR